MKRMISILCTAAMLTALLPIGSFAEEAKKEDSVIFAESFQATSLGMAPADWESVSANPAKKLTASVEAENGNRLLALACGRNGQSGTVSVAKNLPLAGLTNVTIAFRAKTNASSGFYAQLSTPNGDGTASIYSGKPDRWSNIKIVVHFSASTFDTYVDEKQVSKGTPLRGVTNATELSLVLGAVLMPGEFVYIDDVKAEAARAANESASSSGGAITAGKPTEVTYPENANFFFRDGFESYAEGAARSACKKFSGGTGYIEFAKLNGNGVMKYFSDDGAVHWARAEVAVAAEVGAFSMDFAVIPSASTATITLFSDGVQNNANIVSVKAGVNGAKANEWNYVHVDFDMINGKAESTINGAPAGSAVINEIQDEGSKVIRINSKIEADDMFYWDDIAIYTTEEIKAEGVLLGNNQVAFDQLAPENTNRATNYVGNFISHPRIFVQDWDVARKKIAASQEAANWYQTILAAADRCFDSDMTGYKVNSRGNILESARAAEGRLQALGYAYGITGDKKYADRAYEEMLYYGEYPDWSGFNSSLVTAEIAFGFGCAYDWCYDVFTKEQKETIIGILKNQYLPDLIYNYEGKQTSTNFTTGSINWNPVCNACAMGVALAISEEEPGISEYIFEKAPEFIINSLEPYAPSGAYPEGTMYWDYGTTFLTFAMDMLDKSFKPGFELPDKYKYYTYPGISETCDFMIYFNGSTGKFNYGDASFGLINSPLTYWIAEKFDKPEYAWYANQQRALTQSDFTKYNAIVAISWYNPDNASVEPGHFKRDKFFAAPAEKPNGISMRSSFIGNQFLFCAMQGGWNKANHQHLSLGTYSIDYKNRRFVKQLGEHDYALSGGKNTIYYKRAESYNTLTANPSLEADQDLAGYATVIASGESEHTAFGIMDMTHVKEGLYQDAKRGMMLTDQRRRVIIQDETKTSEAKEYNWYANTEAAITLAKDGKSALLEMDGERMLVRIIQGPAGAKFSITPRKSTIEGVRNTTSDGDRLTIHLEGVSSLQLAVEYVGLEQGEGIPEPWKFTPLDEWTAEDNEEMNLVTATGSAVALKLNTPNAIAGGVKGLIDADNAEVVPIEVDGSTLIPVRYIAEAFGTKVSWDEETETVKLRNIGKKIDLQIGSDIMLVDDEEQKLAVPAQTYHDRTFIPLRAFAEALGKEVVWDERGLILIDDSAKTATKELRDKLCKELEFSVAVKGEDLTYVTLERTEYLYDVADAEEIPQVEVRYAGKEIPVTQADSIGESASFVIDGTTYHIKMQKDLFAGCYPSKGDGILSRLRVNLENTSMLPDYYTYIYVESLKDSTEWATYPERGIVDGVINTEVPNRWASDGDGWIQMDFGSEKTVHSMAFAGVSQFERSYRMDILASVDGETWTMVKEDYQTEITEEKMSIIDLGDIQAQYIRLEGKGNNINSWNTWAEVRFYDSAAQEAEDKSLWGLYFNSQGLSGKRGKTARVVLTAVDINNGKFDLKSNAKVQYEVADPSIIKVDAAGNVRFAKRGTTQLTVTVTQDGVTKSETVDVVCE